MVPFLSELWRLAAYLLTPEDSRRVVTGPSGPRARLAKALLWAGLGVLAGLGLGQLN